VILVLYLLVPLGVMLVVAALARFVVDPAREAPAPIGGLFLGIEALLTVVAFALVHWKVNLPDEERCRSDSGVSGILSLILIFATAAVAGIPLASFVGDARRFGVTLARVLAVVVALVLPYFTLAAIVYSFLTCLS
jgi:hypothetical protein